jgi:hypothetical protein
MMAIWGSVEVFQLIQLNLTLNETAIIGIQTYINGQSTTAADQAMDQTLEQANLNPANVSMVWSTRSSPVMLTVTAMLMLPIIGNTQVTATQQSYASS